MCGCSGFTGSRNLDDPDPNPAQPLKWSSDGADDSALPTPTLPPSAVEALRLRCGVHDSAPLASSVEAIFRKILATYLARMPFAAWRGVCTRMLRLLRTRYCQPQRPELPPALLPAGSSESAPDAEAAREGLDHLLTTVGQLVAETLYTELQAAESVRCLCKGSACIPPLSLVPGRMQPSAALSTSLEPWEQAAVSERVIELVTEERTGIDTHSKGYLSESTRVIDVWL